MYRSGKALLAARNKNRDNLFVKRHKLELKRHKLELSGIDKFSFLRPIRSIDEAKIMIDKTLGAF